jgi:hypothetical protein
MRFQYRSVETTTLVMSHNREQSVAIYFKLVVWQLLKLRGLQEFEPA